MNNASINLLIPEKNDSVLTKRIFLLRIFSLSILALIVIAAVTLFFLILSSPLPKLRSEEAETKQKMQQLEGVSGKYFLIRERLASISTIMQSRTSFQTYIEAIQQNMPSDTEITELKAKEKAFSITVSSPSLLSINTFIQTMYSLKNDDKLFSNLILSELNADDDSGLYSVEIETGLAI